MDVLQHADIGLGRPFVAHPAHVDDDAGEIRNELVARPERERRKERERKRVEESEQGGGITKARRPSIDQSSRQQCS